jgi:hypothetical protein
MAIVIQALTDEENAIINGIENNDDYKKNLIKSVIRYEVDHYEITDPQHQDPIEIPDEFIDSHMKDYEEIYDEVAGKPYLNIDATLKSLVRLRTALKGNSVLLHTRLQLFEAGLSSNDPDSPFYGVDTTREVLNPQSIKEEDEKNEENIKINDGARLLVTYLAKHRYGGKDMSQIDLILEKLNYDMERLNESTEQNKAFNIKTTQRAIDIISKIGSADNDEWIKYFKDTIVTDKRAVNLAKEINKDNQRAIKLIDTIFGPEMTKSFSEKFIMEARGEGEMTPEDVKLLCARATLLLYTLAKKIESNMKSKDAKSLIYRGYVIHYMLDDDGSESCRRVFKLFKEVTDAYMNTPKMLPCLSIMVD